MQVPAGHPRRPHLLLDISRAQFLIGQEVSEVESLEDEAPVHRRSRTENDNDSLISASDQENDDEDDNASVATTNHQFQESRTAIRTRIENGRVVIDESSMNVRLGDDDPEEAAGGMETIEEAVSTKFVNSATGSKKKKGDRWTQVETDAFYKVSSRVLNDLTSPNKSLLVYLY